MQLQSIAAPKRIELQQVQRTTMRPLGIYFFAIYIYIYLGYDSFPNDFGRFPLFSLNANGRTYGPADIRTDGQTLK